MILDTVEYLDPSGRNKPALSKLTHPARHQVSMWDPAEHLQALLAKWVVLLLEPQKEEATDERLMRWSPSPRPPQAHVDTIGSTTSLSTPRFTTTATEVPTT